jgi:hypothetical protein
VLPDQRPLSHLRSEQVLANLRSCVHLFDFLQQNGSEARFRDDSTLGAAGLRTDLFGKDGNSVGLANCPSLLEAPKFCSIEGSESSASVPE